MSKIICDICGTSYADTATQCPICGCVRPAQPQAVPEEQTKNGGYTYVKGGRFSKANVKKRAAADKTPKNNDNGNKKGALILLIAIILVGIIALGVILWAIGVFDVFAPEEGAPATTPAPTEPTQPIDVPCEGLLILNKQYTLEQIGDVVLIDCRKLPAESTDVITYTSENEEVATVDERGKVTAVQNGKTNIIITCGSVSESCEIVVGDGEFPVELVLDFTNITLTTVGETKDLYSGSIPVDKIDWTSDNEFIASVSNGKVTAVASGPVTITATYMGKTATCNVLCELGPAGGSGGITEDGGGIGVDGGNDAVSEELVTCDSNGPLRYKNDVTIKTGDSIKLYLGNSAGVRITPEWTCKENDYIQVTANIVTALKSTNYNPITISTVHEGKTYTCVVRVQ